MSSAKASTLRASLGTPEGDDIFGTLDARVVRRLLGLLRPRRLTLAAAQACALLSVVSQLTIPLTIGRALDSAVARSPDRLAFWVMVFGGAAATYVVMFFFEPWLSQRLAQRIINGLRRTCSPTCRRSACPSSTAPTWGG